MEDPGLLILLLVGSCGVAISAGFSDKGLEENVQKTSIVGYNKEKMTKDDKEKEMIRIEKVCQCKVEHLESVGAFILTYDNPSHASISSLNLDPSKEIGMEDQIVTIFDDEIPTDPEFDQQWSLQDLSNNADINAAEGWKKYMFNSNGGDSNGPSVVVAVIDTGVDYNHEDLRDIMWTNTKEIPGNGQDDDNNGIVDDVYGVDFNSPMNGDPVDGHSHGTHCAGIIAAKENNGRGIAGVASFAQGKVKIMAVKGLSDGGWGSLSNLFRGLNYAIDNGATISSNSWGGGVIEDKQEQLWRMVLQNNPNHLFVAAAGNSNKLIDDSYRPWPCGIKEPNLLCVASSTKQDTISKTSSWGSNYGKDYVHVFAPGSDIYSTIPGNGYSTKSGTSMACPHVSGLAALIRTMQPDMNAQQVRELIEANVEKKAQYANIVSSCGLIDMGKTLKDAQWSAPIGGCIWKYNDETHTSASLEQCKQKCVMASFACKSIEFSETSKKCWLSSETKETTKPNSWSEPCRTHSDMIYMECLERLDSVTGYKSYLGLVKSCYSLYTKVEPYYAYPEKTLLECKTLCDQHPKCGAFLMNKRETIVGVKRGCFMIKPNNLFNECAWSETGYYNAYEKQFPEPVPGYTLYESLGKNCYSIYTKVEPYYAYPDKTLLECKTLCDQEPECGAFLMWKREIIKEEKTGCFMIKPNNLFNECAWSETGYYNAYKKELPGTCRRMPAKPTPCPTCPPTALCPATPTCPATPPCPATPKCSSTAVTKEALDSSCKPNKKCAKKKGKCVGKGETIPENAKLKGWCDKKRGCKCYKV